MIDIIIDIIIKDIIIIMFIISLYYVSIVIVIASRRAPRASWSPQGSWGGDMNTYICMYIYI